MGKKIFLSTLFLFTFLLIGCTKKSEPNLTENVKAGLRKDADEFMQSLKSILVKEMQTNGIISAVSVCSDTAQILTNNYGVNKGIYIKRVSFKNRNANNQPDAFETEGLKYFEKLLSNDELTEATEYVEVIDKEGVKSVRYMKPIILQAPCLSCHGKTENIGVDVKDILNKKYPNDKATGYNVGDLRGAVSIQKTL